MKNESIINNIILALSIILSILSLVIAVRAQRNLSSLRTAMEEEMKNQVSQAASASNKATEALKEEIDDQFRILSEYECRDINVKSIAHRGVSEIAPENTIPAFRLAKELGFSCVETDIRFTADGVPVCLHDGSIDRTSNGTGNISELSLEEVKRFDFGAWKDERYEGTGIPTFEEFLILCKNIGLHPYIELKDGTVEQIRSLVDTVNRCGMRGKVSWISFDIAMLSAVRWYDDEARLGYLVSDFDVWSVNEICGLRSGKNETFLNASVYNNWVVEECRKVKLPLEIWTIDKEEQLNDIDPYITGVTSDILRYGQYLYRKELEEVTLS